MMSLLQQRALQAVLPVIRREESCDLVVYDDGSGNATIGWGNMFYNDGTRVKFGDPGISQEEADLLLLGVASTIVLSVHDKLLLMPGPNQLAAMVDLSYNIGLSAFATSSVLAEFNAGDTDQAHADFALWNKRHVKGVLTVSTDLVRRRAREMVLFETPWTDPVGAPHPPAGVLPAPVGPDYRALLTKVARWLPLTADESTTMVNLARSGEG